MGQWPQNDILCRRDRQKMRSCENTEGIAETIQRSGHGQSIVDDSVLKQVFCRLLKHSILRQIMNHKAVEIEYSQVALDGQPQMGTDDIKGSWGPTSYAFSPPHVRIIGDTVCIKERGRGGDRWKETRGQRG